MGAGITSFRRFGEIRFISVGRSRGWEGNGATGDGGGRIVNGCEQAWS